MNWIKYKGYSDDETFKAGTLLKLMDDSLIMLGDANLNLGNCDCCHITKIKLYCNDFTEECNYIKENANKHPLNEHINFRSLLKKYMDYIDDEGGSNYTSSVRLEACLFSKAEIDYLKEIGKINDIVK